MIHFKLLCAARDSSQLLTIKSQVALLVNVQFLISAFVNDLQIMAVTVSEEEEVHCCPGSIRRAAFETIQKRDMLQAILINLNPSRVRAAARASRKTSTGREDQTSLIRK